MSPARAVWSIRQPVGSGAAVRTTVVPVGAGVGTPVGAAVLRAVRATVGTTVGATVGPAVRATIGPAVSAAVGTAIGSAVQRVGVQVVVGHGSSQWVRWMSATCVRAPTLRTYPRS